MTLIKAIIITTQECLTVIILFTTRVFVLSSLFVGNLSFILKKYQQFRTEENIKTSYPFWLCVSEWNSHLVAAHIRWCWLLGCARHRFGWARVTMTLWTFRGETVQPATWHSMATMTNTAYLLVRRYWHKTNDLWDKVDRTPLFSVCGWQMLMLSLPQFDR